MEEYCADLGRVVILNDEEAKILHSKMVLGDTEARTILIESHLRYAFKLAKKFDRNGISLDDLIEEANIALIQAVDKWDGIRPMTPLVKQYVTNALIGALPNKPLVRLPQRATKQIKQIKDTDTIDDIVKRLGVTKRRALELLNGYRSKNISYTGGDKDNPVVDLEDYSREGDGSPCLGDLESLLQQYATPRQEELLRKFYGIGCDKVSLRDLGKHFRISTKFVRKDINRALHKLKNNKICDSCGGEYIPTNHTQRFCTIKCKLDWRDYQKELRIAKKCEEKCIWCGEHLIVTKVKEFTKKFCGKNCANMFRKYGKSKAEVAADKAQRKCDFCKKPLPWDAKKTQRFCNWQCRQASECLERQSKRRTEYVKEDPRRCLWCDNEFGPRSKVGKKFCNATCSNRYHSQQRTKQRIVSQPERRCLQCHTPLPQESFIHKKFCSNYCRNRHRQLQQKKGGFTAYRYIQLLVKENEHQCINQQAN